MLKTQIQPHFLFNTLHTISELIHEDPAAADHMVTRLGDLLRMAVDDGDRQEVALRDELAFVDAYIEIKRPATPTASSSNRRWTASLSTRASLTCCCNRSSRTPSGMGSRHVAMAA